MSLIPLGVLAASAAQPAGGSYDLLETITVGTAVASVEFTNLNATYGSTYKHLQVRIVALSGQANWASIRLNGDATAANYRAHSLIGNGSTVSSAAWNGSTNGASIQILAGSTTPASSVIDILDAFSTSKNKTLRSLTGWIGNDLALTSGLYINTAAITEIRFRHDSSTFSSGTRISIYGIKG